MSDSGDEPVRDQDPIDAWLSAAMDDELGVEEREALEARIARDESAAARARAFHEVDATLRAIARTPEDSARLEGDYQALRARIAAGDHVGDGSGGPGRRMSVLWRPGRVATFAGAAAAALALYVVVLGPESIPQAGSGEGPGQELARASGDAGAPEARDAASAISSISSEDFDVIEQLDLLDYLAVRQTEGQG